jgi:hypothetical protein
MKASKNQIRSDIQLLLSDLAPFGLANAEQVAALLREPKSDDPTFPSGAYVRLMLGKADKPDPSERFCDRFYGLKAWVEKQLGNGSAELAAVTDRLIIRDSYDPTPRIRFVTTHGRALELKEVVIVENADSLIGGLVYIPPDWIGQCHAENCAQFFLRRSANAKFHSLDCRRAETNRRRRERKAKASI